LRWNEGYAQKACDSKQFVQCGSAAAGQPGDKMLRSMRANASLHGRLDHFRFDLKGGNAQKSR
jgi:hypothetical protein